MVAPANHALVRSLDHLTLQFQLMLTNWLTAPQHLVMNSKELLTIHREFP